MVQQPSTCRTCPELFGLKLGGLRAQQCDKRWLRAKAWFQIRPEPSLSRKLRKRIGSNSTETAGEVQIEDYSPTELQFKPFLLRPPPDLQPSPELRNPVVGHGLQRGCFLDISGSGRRLRPRWRSLHPQYRIPQTLLITGWGTFQILVKRNTLEIFKQTPNNNLLLSQECKPGAWS